MAKAIKETLPNEQLIYFGDTLHLPYGEKSAHSIIRYSETITQFLISKKCKAIVIACNSASAHAFEKVRDLLPNNFPLLNVIDPMVKHVKEHHSNEKIGVIGTKATIRSEVYKNRLLPLECISLETPLLASMVEEGFINNEVSRSVISAYLSNPTIKNLDSLILGCTHYPLLTDDINSYYNNQVKVLDSGIVVAKSLKNKLIDFNPVTVSLNEHIECFLEQNKYEIEFEPLTTELETKIDVYWFNVCLKNLVENSLNHGVAPCRIFIKKEEECIGIHVQDSGSLNLKLSDLVKDFYKGNKSEGTGLGLGIVKKINKSMGGDLLLENNPTTFILKIKRKV